MFGVFTLTWVFSGLLSMEPFAWTNATGLEFEREVMTGGPLEIARFPKAEPRAWAALAGDRVIKEVEFGAHPGRALLRRAAGIRRQAGTRGERLHQPYPITGRVEQDRLLVSPPL